MNTKHHDHENTRYDTTKGGIRHLARWTVIVAGSAATAALVGSPSAGAETDRDFQGPYEYQCFIEQPHWNVALDGPVPRCPGPEPAQVSTPEPGSTSDAGDGEATWVGGPGRVR